MLYSDLLKSFLLFYFRTGFPFDGPISGFPRGTQAAVPTLRRALIGTTEAETGTDVTEKKKKVEKKHRIFLVPNGTPKQSYLGGERDEVLERIRTDWRVLSATSDNTRSVLVSDAQGSLASLPLPALEGPWIWARHCLKARQVSPTHLCSL